MKTLLLVFCITTLSFSEIEITAQKQLGLIPDNKPAQTFVFIKNTSNRFIHITKIDTSCSCIRVSQKHKWLAPQQTIMLTVFFVPPFDKKGINQWYIKIFANNKSSIIVFSAFIYNYKEWKNFLITTSKFIKVIPWIILY